MKKVFFAALATVVSVSFMNAQGVASTDNSVTTSLVQEEKVKIKTAELPETIKATLSGEDYKGWTADTAYQFKTSGQYEVTLKKGTETKTIKFDKDGNKID
jgi:hypothetical protein